MVDSPCLTEGARQVSQLLEETEHSRVVFAACDVHAYRRDLLRIAESKGFDPALVRVVDARGGMLQARMEASALRSIDTLDLPEQQSGHRPARVLVVGGGLAGMHAALALAHHDIEVDLVERGEELGSRFASGRQALSSASDLAAHVQQLCRRVQESHWITVHTSTEVLASRELPGYRETTLRGSGRTDTRVTHGATILATGGHEAATSSYGYGKSERIIDQSGLERLLAQADPSTLGTVVMIQCVDSREPGAHPYCSRICCPRALRNAERIREVRPDARIAILYRDMMATGEWERVYTRVRKRGTLCVAYDVERKPNVQVEQGRPRISVRDPILGSRVASRCGLARIEHGR